MAATMKHRRSSRKRKTARGADRYDKVLKKLKKIKKSGGSFLAKSNLTNKYVPAHTVCEDNPEYNGVKVISPKEKKS